MDITISKQELAKALYLTQSIVERKTTMPILSNVLLAVVDGELKISATDLEITAVSKTSVDVRKPGSTTVNAKVFAEIVRELPEGNVSLTVTEGERLEINSQKTRMRMIGVSSDEFPALPGIDFHVQTSLPASQLLEMIAKTIYAVSTDETRFNLNGVCFSTEEIDGEKVLKLVATDGHRLALINRPAMDIDIAGEVIVPRKGLAEIKKLVDGSEDTSIGFTIRDGFLVVETDSTRVSMRLIDGEFPDYKQVLPRQKGVVASMSGGQLSQALKRVALMVTDKGKCVKLDFSQGQLRISSSSPELGDANEELEINYDGEPLSVGFNARYVQEFVASLGEEQEVCIELNGPLGPGKFFSQIDESYAGIVMPMRLA